MNKTHELELKIARLEASLEAKEEMILYLKSILDDYKKANSIFVNPQGWTATYTETVPVDTKVYTSAGTTNTKANGFIYGANSSIAYWEK